MHTPVSLVNYVDVQLENAEAETVSNVGRISLVGDSIKKPICGDGLEQSNDRGIFRDTVCSKVRGRGG